MDLARITSYLNNCIVQLDYNKYESRALQQPRSPSSKSHTSSSYSNLAFILSYRILQSAPSIFLFLRCLPLFSMVLPFHYAPFFFYPLLPSSSTFCFLFLPLSSTFCFLFLPLSSTFCFLFLLPFASFFSYLLLPFSSTFCFCSCSSSYSYVCFHLLLSSVILP